MIQSGSIQWSLCNLIRYTVPVGLAVGQRDDRTKRLIKVSSTGEEVQNFLALETSEEILEECQKKPIWQSIVIMLNKICLQHLTPCLSLIFFGTRMTAQAGKVLLHIPQIPAYLRMANLESGLCGRAPYQPMSFLQRLIFWLIDWFCSGCARSSLLHGFL